MLQNHTRTIFLFERGILGWASLTGDWKNWPNQAIAWIHQNTEHRAQTLLYFTDAFLAGLTRKRRAKQFAELVRQYAGWKIVIVAHSEGTATVIEALRRAQWPKVHSLHLICGACDADFHRNGLNVALHGGKIHRVITYVAGNDGAMKLEDTLLGHWCFGIRTKDKPLGLQGPQNTSEADRVSGAVMVKRWKTFGHSTCWNPAQFSSTMKSIVQLSSCS